MVNKKFFSKTMIVATLMGLMSASAFAAEGGSGWALGVNGGYAGSSTNTTGSTWQSNGDFGAEVRYKLDPMWHAAVSYNMIPYTAAGVNLWTMFIDGEFNYHFAGDLNPLYIGPRAGVMMNGGGATTTTNFNFGAQAGYDYALGGGFAIGPKIIGDITPVSAAGTTTWNTTLEALAQVTYNF